MDSGENQNRYLTKSSPSSALPPPPWQSTTQTTSAAFGSRFHLNQSSLWSSSPSSSSSSSSSMELQGFSSVSPSTEITGCSVTESSLHTERESNGSLSLSPCSSPELGGQGGHSISVKGDEREREFIGTPQPLECLHENPVPPFLSKTYDLVEDRSLDPIISWASGGESFVVWDHIEFARVVLPRNFKHSNFSSFVRQLNTYGFRKIHTDRWEFANEEFVRGKKHLLRNIHRRKSTQLQQISSYSESSIEAKNAGLESEMGMLKNENTLMVQEVLRIRQEHEGTAQKIEAMKQKIQSAEQKQKQMVSFLAKLLQNPVFLARLQQKAELKESGSQRVRRKFIKQQQSDQVQVDSSTGGQVLKYGPHSSSTPKYLATRDLEPVVEKQEPDSPLEGIEGNLGVGVSDTQVQSCNIPSSEMYQESVQSSEQMGVATLDLGLMGSEDAFIKGKNVVSPPLEVGTEYHVLAREKTYPNYMFPQTESMLKPVDVWSMGFDASIDAYTSSQDVLDNFGSSYIWDMGFSGIGKLLDDESAMDDF